MQSIIWQSIGRRLIYVRYCKGEKMAEKIIGVYRITNTVTGDCYIGSSKDVKRRWTEHKRPSSWKRFPNNPMYLDMQRYGIDKFDFQVIEEVEPEHLKEMEQKFIETLKLTYNDRNANGWDFERYKETQKEYQKTEKGKEAHRKANNKYNNQLCFYNGETITLNALRMRFKKLGIDHPVLEAKKYLIKKESKTPIEFYDVYP